MIHDEDNKAYKWAKKGLVYSNKCLHGPALGAVQDRATDAGVNCSWHFFDICHHIGKTAEGRRELDETMSQLRKTIACDRLTVWAIFSFAERAREHGFNADAEEMYGLAMKNSSDWDREERLKVKNIYKTAMAKIKTSKSDGMHRPVEGN